MADAKINLTTEAKNDGLEKLNKALAEGQQSVVEMKKQLKDLERATKDGTQATKEQADAMVNLRKSINEQSAANKEYSKEIGQTTAAIKKSVKAMADGDKGARGLANSFKLSQGFTTAFSVALGSLAATITTGVVAALGSMASQVVSMGAQMQQTVAQLNAMTNVTGNATEAFRALNDVYRNTNFDEQAVQQMGIQLMNMGYSAQNAAGLIQLCADAAAGLGTGQQGAQQLVDAIARMQAVGELTSKQMVGLKMAGLDMDAAFQSLGLNGEQAMKAVEDGTIDTQQAINALTEYLHQFDGKMAESKNNTIDAWGDVTGNISTACAEIGNSIFDAFNQSGIIQELIDFTQSLIDMIRGDGCGAFSDLRDIAGEVLDFIGGLLGGILDIFKLIIIIINDVYGAFKSFGAQVVEAIRPAVDMVLALYNAVKVVLSSVGANFHAEVASSWGATFGGGGGISLPSANNFRPRSYGGGGGGGRSGGGGGGGGRSAATSTAREEREAQRKAEADIKAAKKAYEDGYKDIFNAMQADSKSILDMMLGDKDEATRKIDEIKEKLISDMEAIDQAAAMSINQGDMNPLAAMLKTTPEALQAELDAKGQSLAQFIENYKRGLAETAKAEQDSITTGDQWKNTMQNYAVSVAGDIGDAMTDIITGTKSASEALGDMAKSILKNAVQILTKWLAVYAIFSAFPKALSNNMNATDMANYVVFGVGKHADGGFISGPGTGTSDSIPAMLSNGEYVIRSAAVDRIGIATLNRLNKVGHFADGGLVGSAGGGGFGPNVVVNIENQTGVPVTAEQQSSEFDGERWVIGVVMRGIANNTMGMRTLMQGRA